MSDLISRKWLMECVEEGWIKFDTEKDKNIFIHLVRDTAPSAQPDCTDCIQNGGDFDCDHVHCHKGARLDGYTEQIRWERDIAIEQLNELGYSFGEKIRTDSDTISRQAAIDAIQKRRLEAWDEYKDDQEYRFGHDDSAADTMKILAELPSAQSEIIRCKDCNYYDGNAFPYTLCHRNAQAVEENDYCGWAERREEQP